MQGTSEGSAFEPGPDLEGLLRAHPPLARSLSRDFVPLVERLRRKNPARGFRYDEEFRRELYLSVVATYLEFVGGRPGIETGEPEHCEGIVRTILSAEFYRVVRKETREAERFRRFSDLEREAERGRVLRPEFMDTRAADPGEASALREGLRRFYSTLDDEERRILEACGDGKFWKRSGGINDSLVARTLGVNRRRVQGLYQGLLRRLSEGGYRV